MCTPNKTGVRTHQIMLDTYFTKFIDSEKYQGLLRKTNKSKEDERFVEDVRGLMSKRNREKPYWRDFIGLLSKHHINYHTTVCLMSRTKKSMVCKDYSQAMLTPLKRKRKMRMGTRINQPLTWLVYDILEYCKLMWDGDDLRYFDRHKYIFGLCSILAQIEMGEMILTESRIKEERGVLFYVRDAYGRLQYASDDNTTELILLKIIHQQTPKEKRSEM